MSKIQVLYFVLAFAIFSCEAEKITKNEKPFYNYSNEDWKKRALSDAAEIILQKENIETVWNFNEIAEEDSVSFHYANAFKEIENEKIISVYGYTGCSFGCSGNLLLIYDSISMDLKFVQQVPVVFEFVDVEGDGVDELFTENYVLWMGYCTQYLRLYNLESEQRFFYRENESPDFCGDDKMNYPNPSLFPDTTHKYSSYSFKRNEGRLQLILNSEFRIHHGALDSIQEVINL
ncbi:hypothetical protein K6119_16515 [Paracrocinitomix mangrovi]|uniref:hypothetical protein n=1 Tax=Paracrocinitomix mangrovi TaxID=2862509 RepID=UPI001C8E0E6B|nr:hypothetical protein [Paracrocinitomix mangrovi]UKN01332.1 hypothetical protein K6119_16515 [Paracrocinitomix mangrovi]